MNLFSYFYQSCKYSKTCLKQPMKKETKSGFQDRLSLNEGQKYCRMGSILQYFRPSFSYHLPLRPLFCLCLGGRIRHILLYLNLKCSTATFIFCFDGIIVTTVSVFILTLSPPVMTFVACSYSYFLDSLYCKQYGPRSDCSLRSSLIWVHSVCNNDQK